MVPWFLAEGCGAAAGERERRGKEMEQSKLIFILILNGQPIQK